MKLNAEKCVRLNLKYRNIVSITPNGAEPLTVACEQGIIWITIAGLSLDIVLKNGDSATLPAKHLAVIQALDAATFVLKDHGLDKAA